MAVYIGHDECRVIYVAKNGKQLRVSSVWVGDQQVFPPANRQEIHVFTRDTQGYGRDEQPSYYAFTVPVPWWATAVDVVLLGAGEKGRDGTKSFTGGTDGAGGRSGAWKVVTTALTNHHTAFVQLPKGNSVSPPIAALHMPTPDGVGVLVSTEGSPTTPNNGSAGGSVTPLGRTEYNQTHAGGPGGSRNIAGQHPGGGGGGGQGSNLLGNPREGQPGGDGYVWLRFRSAPALNPGDGGSGFILFVGVTSGFAFNPLREWAVSIGETYQTITEITVPMEVVGPSLRSLFFGCSALTSVPVLDTSQVTDMRDMFSGCSSLTSVPALDTSSATDMEYMFYGCSALTSVPVLDTSQVTDMYAMFRDCSALTSVPVLDTSQVTNMYDMFRDCSSLTSVPALNTSQVTDMGYMFDGCSSLESVTLPGMGNAFPFKQTLDMRDTKLSVAAANALMDSLGTPAPGGTLRLPTTATGADTSIATAKNWEVTIG